MAWSDEEKKTIQESVWKTGGARCPVHGSELEIATFHVADTDRQGLDVGCVICRQKATFLPKDDPTGNVATSWNEVQKADMLAKARKGEAITCPSDGSLIVPTEEPALGSPIVGARADQIFCGRCGQTHRVNR